MSEDVVDLNKSLKLENNLIEYKKIQTTGGESGSPVYLEFFSDDKSHISQ
jgi:V8-like Glu-specific endopeptidase